MKGKGFFILTVIFFLVVFFTQLKLINHPVVDNDEGIYLTSFLLVDRGYPAYKKTYFSQPPGFLLTVYPGFVLFGKTLQAARLTISLWSMIGLLAVIWLGFELKNKWMGLLAAGLLMLMPSYFNQSLTFQSDILITTFSLISLAALIRFGKNFYLPWFIISTFFLNLSFWTKFDVTFFPSFILSFWFIYRKQKIFLKKIINLFLITIVISLGFFIIFISPFGIREVFNNSILLRFQAAKTTTQSYLLFNYLKKDTVMLIVILVGLIMSFLKRNKLTDLTKIILIWNVFILILLCFYNPLFPHHLVMIAVPAVLLFSLTMDDYFVDKKIFKYILLIVLIFSFGNRINLAIKTSSSLINNQQQKAIAIIKKHTTIDEVVISDEEILTGLSVRLPPPELSDISKVRIRSNNLTSENFAKIISDYKPKLIIPWNGRLESIKNFKKNLSDYELLTSFSNSKNIYIRKAP